MRVAVTQPNYIPWLGFFSLIHSVDIWVSLEDVQYTARDWRNRNRIKTPGGAVWLTIPIAKPASSWRDLTLRDAEIADGNWAERHLEQIRRNYRSSGAFAGEFEFLQHTLQAATQSRLADVTVRITIDIMRRIGIKTTVKRPGPENAPQVDSATERIKAHCQQVGAKTYVTGPRGLNYLDRDHLRKCGISVEVYDYPQFPSYQQPWGPFLPNLSVIDGLLNLGHSSLKLLL